MLLRNFCKTISVMPDLANSSSYIPNLLNNDNSSVQGGSNKYWYYPYTSSAYYVLSNGRANSSYSSSYYQYSGILLGTGTTTPTFDDVALESPLLTLDPVGNPSYTLDRDNGLFRWVMTVRNNTASDISFSEVGLVIARIPSSGVFNNYILLTRDVLSSPITVPAGEDRTISVEINTFKFSTGYNVV